jgi:hypothetical protein
LSIFVPRATQNGDEDSHDEEEFDSSRNLESGMPEDDFYRDLKKAKASKLGASIPSEQLQQMAAQAESAFLQAMKETQEDFQRAKEELGPDGAVDLFLNRIRKEDERQQLRCDNVNDAKGRDGDAIEDFQ